MVRVRVENNGNNRIFTNIPQSWLGPIKKSYLKYCNEFIERDITLNVYIKELVVEIAKRKIDITGFSYEKIVSPIIDKKNKKWRALSFSEMEIKQIYKHINKLEKSKGISIKNDHYILACLWEALPFLRKKHGE